MIPRSKLLAAFLVAIALLPVAPVRAQGSTTIVVATVSGTVGSVLPVGVSVHDAESLAELELVFEYDPAVVEAVDVGPGALFTGEIEDRLEAPGRLRIRAEATAPVHGSGELLRVSLRVLGEGRTELATRELSALDTEGQAIELASAPGSMTTRAPGLNRRALVVGLILLLAIAGLVIYLRRA